MMVICVVALWEGGRHCYRRAEAVRMRSLQAEQRLSKKEMRKLNQVLQRDPDDLSSDDKEVLFALAERVGVDLKKILTKEPAMGSATALAVREKLPPPSQPPSEAACRSGWGFFAKEKRAKHAGSSPRSPKAYVDLLVLVLVLVLVLLLLLLLLRLLCDAMIFLRFYYFCTAFRHI